MPLVTLIILNMLHDLYLCHLEMPLLWQMTLNELNTIINKYILSYTLLTLNCFSPSLKEIQAQLTLCKTDVHNVFLTLSKQNKSYFFIG